MNRATRRSSDTPEDPGRGFLPTTAEEARERGWDAVDVVFVTGDAYVDHPSFAMAILSRVLEAAGFRVAILSQPDWRGAEPFRAFGRPRVMFAVSAGNMDSMLNHYTANRRLRSDDAYSPGGVAGRRPDRATAVYAQRCREAFPGVPVVIGGVEASLRRVGHYDFWSDTVRPSMLVSSKADLLVYGMGEEAIVEIAQRLRAGEPARGLRDLRGTCYLWVPRRKSPNSHRPCVTRRPLTTTPTSCPRSRRSRRTRSRSLAQPRSSTSSPIRSTLGACCSATARGSSSRTHLGCRSTPRRWTRSMTCPTCGGPTRPTTQQFPRNR